MIETNRIYEGDCLDVMKQIDTSSIDLIICDPPYGTINQLETDGYKKRNEIDGNCTSWDIRIDTKAMLTEYERILRTKGIAIIFSQEPYTHELRSTNITNLEFLYPMIWKKNNFGNPLISKVAPLSYFEDLSVFCKTWDSALRNPVRDYFKELFEYIGLSKKEIYKITGNQKFDHCFRFGSMQFAIPSRKQYEELITTFRIDKYDGFLTFEKMLKLCVKEEKTFNIPKNSNFISNILEFRKDSDHLHPTQKPLSLCEFLINVYSNENDIVLDNCCGSGTTCLASKNNNRRFIGIEKEHKYVEIANARLKSDISR